MGQTMPSGCNGLALIHGTGGHTRGTHLEHLSGT